MGTHRTWRPPPTEVNYGQISRFYNERKELVYVRGVVVSYIPACKCRYIRYSLAMGHDTIPDYAVSFSVIDAIGIIIRLDRTVNYTWQNFIEKLASDRYIFERELQQMEEYMSEEPRTSPTMVEAPRDENALDFMDALRAVIDGKAITKLEWDDPSIHVILKNERLMILLDDGILHPLIVTLGDLLGDDWVVV